LTSTILDDCPVPSVESFLDQRTALLRRIVDNYSRSAGTALSDVRILDIGCKHGDLVFYLLKRGYDVYGVDPVHDYVQQCTHKQAAFCISGKRFFTEACGDLTFEDASFDVACAFMVLEHVRNLESFLQDVRRVLKPGGVFLCLVPNLWWPIEGHVRLPFAHWLPERALARYLALARKDPGEWVAYIKALNYYGGAGWLATLRRYFDNVDDLTTDRIHTAARSNDHKGIRRVVYALMRTYPGSYVVRTALRRMAPLSFACRRS
jgi:SAM-dependent methyltransferase